MHICFSMRPKDFHRPSTKAVMPSGILWPSTRYQPIAFFALHLHGIQTHGREQSTVPNVGQKIWGLCLHGVRALHKTEIADGSVPRRTATKTKHCSECVCNSMISCI